MGYLFLAVSVFSGAVKGFCGKKTSSYVSGSRDAVLANLIRMLLCSAIGFIFLLAGRNLNAIVPDGRLLPVAALSGVTTSVFVICWLIAVRKSAYMMLDVFLMPGVVVTLILSNLFFGEAVRPMQWLGIAVLFVAVLLMCGYNNSFKAKISPASFMLLILCGLANGLTDFSQKLFVRQAPDTPISVFNFYTYLFSAAVLLLAYIIAAAKAKRTEPVAPTQNHIRQIFGYIAVMSVCLFLYSYFKTKAAGLLDAVLLYPLSQGCSIVLSTVMAAVFFREKLTPKGLIGIVTAFFGLILINLL